MSAKQFKPCSLQHVLSKDSTKCKKYVNSWMKTASYQLKNTWTMLNHFLRSRWSTMINRTICPSKLKCTTTKLRHKGPLACSHIQYDKHIFKLHSMLLSFSKTPTISAATRLFLKLKISPICKQTLGVRVGKNKKFTTKSDSNHSFPGSRCTVFS